MTLCERSEPQLDIATLHQTGGEDRPAQWRQVVYPEAGEVVLYVAAEPAPEPVAEEEPALLTKGEVEHGQVLGAVHGPDLDDADKAARKAQRSIESAAARARTKVRRYCKANRLDRLFTLTFSVPRGDLDDVAREVMRFFMRLQYETGSMPYLWVRERHKSGSLHVHFALARPLAVRCDRCKGRKGLHVKRVGGPCLRCTWGLGFVDARRLKVSTGRQAAVTAAAYLAKYVGKAYEAQGIEGAPADEAKGKRRYSVAPAFVPLRVDPEAQGFDVAGSDDEVLDRLGAWFFGGRKPVFVWSSDMAGDSWEGPPVRVAFFDPPPD